MKNEVLNINGIEVAPGEKKQIRIHVGRLPSGTQINIHAQVFRAMKEGPCMLVLAGVHGDEINGVEIVRRALDQGYFDHLTAGTAIVIPLLNVYGFLHFSREVPDGKDVNRSFPGNFKGSLASRVARTLTKRILPVTDFGVDFHTGGANRYNFPQIRYTRGSEPALELAKGFAPPLIFEKPAFSKTLRKEAHKMKVPILVYEGGEALRLDGLSIDTALSGLKRLMKSQGMIEGAPEVHRKPVHVKKSGWVRAAVAGVFEWMKDSGHPVVKGEIIGFIRDPHGGRRKAVTAPKNGFILGHNNSPVVNQGDALFNVGYTMEKWGEF
jgi:predicted deacylase